MSSKSVRYVECDICSLLFLLNLDVCPLTVWRTLSDETSDMLLRSWLEMVAHIIISEMYITKT